MDRFTLILDNLAALGKRKLMALALTFALVVGLVSAAAYYLSRPNFEVLYAGLDREDVSRIGSALKSSGISFDVNPEGNAISVPYGQTSQARMLLAERGLPQSANAGYELFDKVGALGLTSFMQEVTRVRALEGELARTIQLIRGVKAARVHIVMPDEGSFRRAKQASSASVIIRTEGPDDSSAAQAIRHLVASSLPGMTVDQVTVLNTDGMILSSSDGEPNDAIPVKTLTLEKTLSKDIQDNIRRTLTPYLKLANFQVSVRARVNTDRKQINETIYDPESRVERSVRTVKETAQSTNNSGGQSTSVDRNIPQGGSNAGSDAKNSNDESKKSEELTNFELSSKTVTTMSGGYNIENLSVAVLINRAAFSEPNKEAPKPEAIDRQLKEIEQLIVSAAGLKKERGDSLKVTAVDFTFNEHDMTAVENPGFMTTLGNHLGSFINALTAVGIAVVIVAFGLAPARRALLAEQPAAAVVARSAEEAPALAAGEPAPLGIEPSFDAMAPPMLGMAEDGGFAMPSFLDGMLDLPKDTSRRKLERLIDRDDAHAAAIMKQWMRS
jgi:flagellar M-ring protein FliF